VVIYFLSLSRMRTRAPCLFLRLPFFVFFFLNVKIKEQNSGRRGREERSMMIYDVLLTVDTRHGAAVPLKIEGKKKMRASERREKQSVCLLCHCTGNRQTDACPFRMYLSRVRARRSSHISFELVAKHRAKRNQSTIGSVE
jgi:hypothetical protein